MHAHNCFRNLRENDHGSPSPGEAAQVHLTHKMNDLHQHDGGENYCDKHHWQEEVTVGETLIVEPTKSVVAGWNEEISDVVIGRGNLAANQFQQRNLEQLFSVGNGDDNNYDHSPASQAAPPLILSQEKKPRRTTTRDGVWSLLQGSAHQQRDGELGVMP